jgi:hypothetical protein
VLLHGNAMSHHGFYAHWLVALRGRPDLVLQDVARDLDAVRLCIISKQPLSEMVETFTAQDQLRTNPGVLQLTAHDLKVYIRVALLALAVGGVGGDSWGGALGDGAGDGRGHADVM